MLNYIATAPTDLGGVNALSGGYLVAATVVAVLSAVLGLGWCGYVIVKDYVKGAKSK